MSASVSGFRKVIIFAGLANFSFFFVEVAVALSIGSVGLFADSVDFLEDACVNLLVLYALHASLLMRARVGMVLSASILLPSVATLWMAWHKFMMPLPPQAFSLSVTGGAALIINLTCAYLLAAHRDRSGSLSKAAFLSARNDVIANVAIIVSGGLTVVTRSGWPDLIVGLGIGAMNVDAARAVWQAARSEHKEAKASP
jgi:Co/Zn/Cd efflux system component